jgi:hypothetical protein
MELSDFDVRVAYFHEATDEHLARLGVDRSRLQPPDAWRASFEQNLARPVDERSEYGLVWEVDGELVGFSTADQIRIGDEAHMHLHIVDPQRRASGLGTQFVRLTAAHLCEVLTGMPAQPDQHSSDDHDLALHADGSHLRAPVVSRGAELA